MRLARSARAGGGPRLLAVVLAVAVIATAIPPGSYTLGNLPRATESNVVTVVEETLGFDVAASATTPSVNATANGRSSTVV